AIGELRVGDRGFATERVDLLAFFGCGALEDRVEPLVDLAVDAAHKEAGDGSNVLDVLPGGNALLQASHVRLDDSSVCVEREQQGDVDVQPTRDQATYRIGTFDCPRHLDHHVRPVDRGPEPRRLAHRA